jgi:hypothetical protein
MKDNQEMLDFIIAKTFEYKKIRDDGEYRTIRELCRIYNTIKKQVKKKLAKYRFFLIFIKFWKDIAVQQYTLEFLSKSPTFKWSFKDYVKYFLIKKRWKNMSLDIYLIELKETEVYEANITHNLAQMATKAGLYDCLWRAVENGYEKAFQLVEPLEKGIKQMEENPERYKQYNAKNGWGNYFDFLPWLKKLLAVCKRNPDANIKISR